MGAGKTRVARNAARQAHKNQTLVISESRESATVKFDRQDGVTQNHDERQDGIVKWFHDAKGYGFITAEAVDEDVYVHNTHIEMTGFRTLQEGQKVSMLIVPGSKGPSARQVRLLS